MSAFPSRTCKLPSPLPRGSSPMMANGLAASQDLALGFPAKIAWKCGVGLVFSVPTVQQKVAAAAKCVYQSVHQLANPCRRRAMR